jgi:hypothetical protein
MHVVHVTDVLARGFAPAIEKRFLVDDNVHSIGGCKYREGVGEEDTTLYEGQKWTFVPDHVASHTACLED